ncbi:hypothetical protein OHA40_10300 [Nocardia sp. NBC_00508]|uniref:hypothetical protein n=1 Tax=Nocardia sp. NBC_00508 TaxID=2975992 RepID=UPI002E8134E4|nr:hypothetical protein [Nocardia sp. NBC_00508]WUD68457.1 hypothetical protein OHA40_10300 [Nocardia sp. NBC_00508]
MSDFWNVSSSLACLSVGISLYGAIAYLAGILEGDTRPRIASWAAWCTANTVFAVVAYLEGAHLAASINAAAAAMNAAVIAVGITRGSGLRPGDNIDWACLISSIACVMVTVEVPEKAFGALFAVCANLIATVPTLRHAWFKPHEETWQMFAANAFAGGLGLLGVLMVSGFEFASIAGPLISAAGNVGLVALTVGRGRFTDDAVVPVRVG